MNKKQGNMNSTRRNFIKSTSTALGATVLLSQLPLGLTSCTSVPNSFGFQVWTIREQLFADFEGTLKKMANMGYKEVEMCSPLGYKGTFDKFKEVGGTELRKIIEDQGLICRSSHYNLGELRNGLEQSIEWSHQMGIEQMVLAAFWLPEDASVDDYRKSCEELNKIGEKIKAAGLQTVFHNHHMEFQTIGDELVYDEMLKVLNPEIVKMQFQVAVADIGYKAADYFRNYPGRFISAHLADYSSELKKQVPVGEGIVDWDDFFKAARVGKVKNFFVEMAPDTFAPSAQYLLDL